MSTEPVVTKLDDGKYTVYREEGLMYVHRYNEPWRDLTGDKFIGALLDRIHELEEQLKPAPVRRTAISWPEPENMDPPWTQAMEDRGIEEGWVVSYCWGSDYGPWQIQRIDNSDDWPEPRPPQHGSDDDAWKVVLAGTEPHHAAAIAFMKAHNPTEFEYMSAWVEQLKGNGP